MTSRSKDLESSRPYRSGLVRRIARGLVCIVIFVMLTLSLDRLDSTPRWASVSFPPFAVQGAPYSVGVRLRNLSERAQVNAKIALHDKNGQSLGGKAVDKKVLSERPGQLTFEFTLPGDANAVFAQFSVSCGGVSEETKTESLPLIRSGSISILPSDHPKVINSLSRPAWHNIVAEAIDNGYWLKKWGDPTLMGWGITVCYALVGCLCLYCTGYLDSRRTPPISHLYAWFWWIMAVSLMLLAINKQLDLQMLLADIGRAFTKHQGWYAQRRPVQIRILVLGVSVGFACLQEIGYRLKGAPRSTGFALWGVVLLGINVLIHLVSLHWMERVLSLSVLGLTVGTGFEIFTILWIAASAAIYNHTGREQVSYIMQ